MTITLQTRQEMFDKIWERAQDKRKARRKDSAPGGDCAYRGRDNLCCFVGIFIPDANYTPIIEGFAIGAENHDMKTALRHARLPMAEIDDRRFLADIQRVHDMREPEQWNDWLQKIAYNNSLNCPKKGEDDAENVNHAESVR